MDAQKQRAAAQTPKILTDGKEIRRILDRSRARVARGPLRVLVEGTPEHVDSELVSLSHASKHLKEEVILTALYAIEHCVGNFDTDTALKIARVLELPKERVKLAILAGVVGDYVSAIGADTVILEANTKYLGDAGITDVDLNRFLEERKPAGLWSLERRG